MPANWSYFTLILAFSYNIARTMLLKKDVLGQKTLSFRFKTKSLNRLSN